MCASYTPSESVDPLDLGLRVLGQRRGLDLRSRRAGQQVLVRIQLNRFVDTHQPISRFSPFQLIESGVFVGLSVMALVVAVWWIPRQTA